MAVRRQFEPDIGGRDAVAPAFQDPRADGFLEDTDVAAERRLGQAQALGRLGIGAGIDDGGELHQVAGVDDHSNILYVD